MGIEANGHEVFKFELSDEQHHKLLGVAKSMLQQKEVMRQGEKAHDRKALGKFIALSDRDSDNDFTDNGSTFSPTSNNAGSKSGQTGDIVS